MKLLFIGNSYTNRNDLPRLVQELAASAPHPKTVQTERVLANGASLRQHWNAGTAIETIRRAEWDFVVLQEQSTLPLKNPTRYHENVRLFDAEIKANGARTMLYETWARRNAPETQTSLTGAVAAIAQEIGALVAPVGSAWSAVLNATAPPELFDADGSHPAAAGSYLAACVFHATLFGESPVGLAVPERLNLAAEDATMLQNTAWQVVAERLSATTIKQR